MKIQLPKEFEYHDKLRSEAYVKDEILYMPTVSYERIMYALTYAIKGTHRCYYCGKELKPNRCTLDHIYPRFYGGISIPNNLVPCCSKCNDRKSNLLLKQYREIRKMQDKKLIRRRIEYYQEKNAKLRKKHGIILPESWYEMKTEYSVIGTFTSEQPTKSSRKYQSLQEQFEMYGKICKPVIVSRNRFVLDGFLVLFLAKNLGITTPIPFITLENVVAIV